ncbi:MAG: GDYXXLXY domain-containing protein [Hyphomonadaceae bacterium]
MKIAAAHRILAIAGICAAALIGLVVSEGYARDGGQEITLPMAAVDPRSLLHGHYVLLNFTDRLEAGETCPEAGDWQWVALRREGDIYVIAGGATSRDDAERLGSLPVKGSFDCMAPTPATADAPELPGWLRLDVGVDRFHINQTDAVRIEQVLRGQSPDEGTRALAVLSVGRDGRARLKALLIDGERFDLNWL